MDTTPAQSVVSEMNAQDYMLFLYVLAISIGGGVAAICLKPFTSFKEAAATFFGSVAFGSLIGGISLAFYSKLAYALAGACSLFARKIYGLAEKKLPNKLVDKAENIIKP